MSLRGKSVIYGLYDDESILLNAVKEANNRGLKILDVFSPFPVHGLDPLLGLEESRLHIAGFVYGMIGALTGFGFMTWLLASDWQVIYGGKPYWPIPSYIPITFELTVLFASVGMVVTFYAICGLAPGFTNPTLDDRITDDKFCIAFDADQYENLDDFFNSTDASEHSKKSFTND